MRNLLALVGLLVILFLGIGYSRGWYNLNFKTGADGKLHVDGTIDKDKVKTDSGAGLKSAAESVESFWKRNAPGSAAPPATLPVQKSTP